MDVKGSLLVLSGFDLQMKKLKLGAQFPLLRKGVTIEPIVVGEGGQ